MRKIKIEFYGIDSWNRPIFKSVETKSFFGDTDNLFDYDADEEKVIEFYSKNDNIKCLSYFGTKFDCEPLGVHLEDIELEIV